MSITSIKHIAEDYNMSEKELMSKINDFGIETTENGHVEGENLTLLVEMLNEEIREAKGNVVEVDSKITVQDLATEMDKPASEIIMKLMKMGTMATINQEVSFDIASLICSEYGFTLMKKDSSEIEELEIEALMDIEEDLEKDLKPRPPVVTVMGHVDHGKTSLLDAIRDTDVTSGEAGGITQHIGASEVKINGQKIVFLDTPGHEAFTSMRARGAQVTDIAILVVAADDGIMPQTIEAINHAKAASVPLIVAINKIDKPGANPERVKQELSEQGLLVEDWGGDVISVELSAKKRINIETLLEMVLLVAEVEELKANPDKRAVGTVIEAELDKGKRVKQAGPSTAVEILGLSEVPQGGDQFVSVPNDKAARTIAEKRQAIQREEMLKASSKVSLDDLFAQMSEGKVKDLNIVIKADVQGSVQAVKQSLEKLSNDEVAINVIHGGVGAITESDVLLASASNAIIIGFNVRPVSGSEQLAEKESVDIRTYTIIYKAIEDMKAAMSGMLDPDLVDEDTGKVEIREIYKISGVGTVAGCYVLSGKIIRNSKVRIVRDGIIIHEGELAALKRFKDDVKEVSHGYECGLSFVNYNDIKVGDIVEAYIVKEVERTID